MIYTVTFNPSIDYRMELDEFIKGQVNRSKSESYICGGKGVNVSIVLKNLGLDSVATGYVAGFTGDKILNSLEDMGITCRFVRLDNGESRINVKLNIKNNVETEINGNGPMIHKNDIDKLYSVLNCMTDGDVLVLAGSIPTSVESSIYEDIMEQVRDRDIRVVVDATGKLLLNVLRYKPFLIKPNHHELGELWGMECNNRESIIHYGKQLQKSGARNVLVSRASDGAILLAEDGQVYECSAPSGHVVNSVGAGDSAVAGFLTEYMRSGDYKKSLKYAVATGSATAFSQGLATLEEVEGLYKEGEIYE